MFLLDTNICIYFMNNKYPALTRKLLSRQPSELLISSVTVFELKYGAEKSNWGEKTRQKLDIFLAAFTILPLSLDDACMAGRIRAYLQRQGRPIGPYDVLLAGQAVARNLTFVTHNTAEFARVPELDCEDWVEG